MTKQGVFAGGKDRKGLQRQQALHASPLFRWQCSRDADPQGAEQRSSLERPGGFFRTAAPYSTVFAITVVGFISVTIIVPGR